MVCVCVRVCLPVAVNNRAYYFAVSFGGAASLFVGCSVWKLTRLGYVLLVKLTAVLVSAWLRLRWMQFNCVR